LVYIIKGLQLLIFFGVWAQTSVLHSEEYKRQLYKHWIDFDHDCQDTRTEMLIRDTHGNVKFKRHAQFVRKDMADRGNAHQGQNEGKFTLDIKGQKVAKPCVITTGHWIDGYTGKIYSRANDLDLDHVIPLKYAHVHGAGNWGETKRKEFANDPENLILTWKSINRQKGDKGPLRWMPPQEKVWCSYLSRWEKLVSKYKIRLSKAELSNIAKLKKPACAKSH